MLDIRININDNNSHIMFLFGNEGLKSSVPERIIVPCVISFEEIENIIDFILEDHEAIKSISIIDREIDLKFAINWRNESIKGIYCSDIGLNFKFDSIALERQYLYLLFQRYYTYLEKTPSFIAMKDEYINSMKQSYFETLGRDELISLLNGMNDNELKGLLSGLDNDVFIKYVMNTKHQPKKRKLLLETED